MRISSILILIFAFSITSAQSIETKNYDGSDEVIANPERGLYHHTEVRSTNYVNLNLNTLINYRENESITQILRVFYLEEFVSKSISKEYLDNMHKDFDIAREAGIKVIIRLAYTKTSSKPYGDAKPSRVRDHIFQLKEVFAQHKDVISVIQTGFVGAWGEWYYTDHFAGSSPWIITDENWDDRADVVDNLLEVVPKDRMIQLRTPGYKMRIFDRETPIGIPDAYNQNNISRVGHHNDCFVASSSDFGTYTDQALEKPYLESETTYLPMGGETCALAPPYSDCENAYSELTRFHWSYLNIDYNNTVLDVWKEQGCFDDVERNLGYRYVLQEASLHTDVHPEGKFELTIKLLNEGFANPYNPRNLEVILQSTTTPEKTYKLTSSAKPGLWPIQQEFDITITGGFPETIVDGEYEVYLSFPDASPSLADNPNYAIRLANQNIWQEENGWNKLAMKINIDDAHTKEEYIGDFYFVDKNQVLNDGQGPTSIYYGVNTDASILFWSKSSNYEYRIIEKSANGIDFSPVATLSAEIESYKITADPEEQYYRFILTNETDRVISNTIQAIGPSSSEDSRIDIISDGQDEDWKDTQPTSTYTSEDNISYILRSYFSIEKVHFALYGSPQDYRIYLNTDNDVSTGFPSGILTGMDYLIEDELLYSYDGSNWNIISNEILKNVGNITELNLNFELFDNLKDNTFIPIVAYLNDDSILLSYDENTPAKHVRNLPPDLPTNFEVRNSIPYPEERLEIHWEVCEYCDGYILEKSDDGVEFTFLKDLDPDKEVYYHDFLPNGKHYYRIQSYNELGNSPYSNVENGILGTTNTKELGTTNTISVWPNPTNGIINTPLTAPTISIFDSQGKFIQKIKPEGKTLDIKHLSSGSYILILKLNDQVYRSVVIKD